MAGILEYIERLGIHPQKVASTNGGEYASACPACGGEDRFRIWPEQKQGAFWCRQCEKKGDIITFLMHFHNMTFPEACRELGRPLPNSSRMRQPLQQKPEIPAFTPRQKGHPPDVHTAKWQEKAAKLTAWAHEKLLANHDQLAWLAARGIEEDLIVDFSLGWIPENLFRPREAWGLPTVRWENGKPKRLLIPAGLVIPLQRDGAIRRLRIRRIDHSPKYYVMPGSAMMPMICHPGQKAFVIVETELDAIMLAGQLREFAGAIALGSSSSKPDIAADRILRRAFSILVALDFDAAGTSAWPWWEQTYPQAERWPVPEGKDPGEAFEKGVDLRIWALTGLPPSFRIGLSPLDNKKGESINLSTTQGSVFWTDDGTEPVDFKGPIHDDAPETIKQLYGYLKNNPVKIRATNKRITLIEDETWANRNWGLSRRISALVFFNAEVFEYLCGHPDKMITGENFWLKE
jgi:hypothetical protein